jgi:hypothetical protein
MAVCCLYFFLSIYGIWLLWLVWYGILLLWLVWFIVAAVCRVAWVADVVGISSFGCTSVFMYVLWIPLCRWGQICFTIALDLFYSRHL